MHARRILSQCADVWPIKESAARPPEGWAGWPEGKQFALVLTHDVESQAGLDRVRQLAELEMQLGVRSSFNFIPEGPYLVPKALLEWLVDNGFEIGVHDLHHDGHLFRSRAGFAQKARRINHYLHEWGATGFRSGFMLNELDWLHDLDIQYDASTFDTDPFEPQPDGVATIFPFWVSRPGSLTTRHSSLVNRDGYVEMPYTLPQDSTLFVLLCARTSDVWMQKAEWIAEHGGMVLLDTHPDYMNFDETNVTRANYPVRLYAEFVERMLSRYAEDYWHVLPRAIGELVSKKRFRKSSRPNDVLSTN